MVHEFLTMTLTELTTEIRERRISPVQLMEVVLARIDETNPDLNAIVAMFERVKLLEDAKASEARVARGEARPLEGIPLGVKDLEDVAGLVTSHGSLIYKDHVAPADSTQVERLKAAGAIVVGKTNAPEFGYTAITKNLVYGSSHSPWNLLKTPGGSSGGSAAAMAGCVLPLVTSSDGGGSIRIPASFTGCFGLKTSFGRVPIGPSTTWPYGDTGVYGPTTKTVEDAALFMDQVVGPSPYDPNSLPHPGISYQEALDEPLPKLRIGFSSDLGYAVVQSDVAKAVDDGARVFERLGHTVETIEGGPPPMGVAWGLLGNFWSASSLHRYLPERELDFGYTFIAGVRRGWEMTPELFGEMAEARERLNRWTADVFSRYDLLITPTVPYDAPPARGPFPVEVEGRELPPVAVASFTIPFNLSWHPAATVRAGISSTGLPMGMQIVGPRHRDDLVLRASLAWQRERPWHPHWPTEFRRE